MSGKPPLHQCSFCISFQVQPISSFQAIHLLCFYQQPSQQFNTVIGKTSIPPSLGPATTRFQCQHPSPSWGAFHHCIIVEHLSTTPADINLIPSCHWFLKATAGFTHLAPSQSFTTSMTKHSCSCPTSLRSASLKVSTSTSLSSCTWTSKHLTHW